MRYFKEEKKEEKKIRDDTPQQDGIYKPYLFPCLLESTNLKNNTLMGEVFTEDNSCEFF